MPRFPIPDQLTKLTHLRLTTLCKQEMKLTPEDIANDDVLLAGQGAERRREILVAVHWLVNNDYATMDDNNNTLQAR